MMIILLSSPILWISLSTSRLNLGGISRLRWFSLNCLLTWRLLSFVLSGISIWWLICLNILWFLTWPLEVVWRVSWCLFISLINISLFDALWCQLYYLQHFNLFCSLALSTFPAAENTDDEANSDDTSDDVLNHSVIGAEAMMLSGFVIVTVVIEIWPLVVKSSSILCL